MGARSRSKDRKPVLLVQHAPHEHPAVIRRALESQGILSHWIHPYRGEKYPELKEIAGIISLGGPMGANDEADHPWIQEECDLLKACTQARLPVVGVCLGGQMLARAMGGEVQKNPIPEVGWFPIQINAEGKKDRIIRNAGSNPVVYQWHNDTFFPPKDAVLLAGSQHCPRQAFRIGDHAYGFQFHPEADHQLVHEWLSIEGVEEEIEEARKAHGGGTVQDANTQRGHAAKGEKASLKITAAIGGLFQNEPYEPVSRHIYDQFEEWATHRTLVVIEFTASDQKPLHLKGYILMILSIPAGDFIIFREENTILWPIRLDHIGKVNF